VAQKQADQFRCLVADIGGTNLRVATTGRDTLDALETYSSEQVSDPGQVLADYAAKAGGISCAVVAVAGPVAGERFSLTNRDWSCSLGELKKLLRMEQVVVVNDFAAMARSVTGLSKDDLIPVRAGEAVADGNVLVCGPGTGFGVSVLVPGEGGRAIASEAGHMRLGATSEEEFDALAKLRGGEEPPAIEHVLSGRGLVALDRALNGSERKPADILSTADSDAGAARTLRLFMRIFGRTVGDLALAFDARGGIFIGGGLGLALRPFYYAMPEFLAAYEQHEPYADRLRKIPISLIAHPYPGLIGAAEIARRLFGECNRREVW
jgi:glucokinase